MRMIITSGGRVTVPKAVREYLGLTVGSAVTFELVPSGDILMRPVEYDSESSSPALENLGARVTVRMTTEEIMTLMRSD
jgi:antitoxin PrlF